MIRKSQILTTMNLKLSQSGSIENDVENNNQNDKTKSNNTRRDNTRVHR